MEHFFVQEHCLIVLLQVAWAKYAQRMVVAALACNAGLAHAKTNVSAMKHLDSYYH
jgi:hypothetical protein